MCRLTFSRNRPLTSPGRGRGPGPRTANAMAQLGGGSRPDRPRPSASRVNGPWLFLRKYILPNTAGGNNHTCGPRRTSERSEPRNLLQKEEDPRGAFLGGGSVFLRNATCLKQTFICVVLTGRLICYCRSWGPSDKGLAYLSMTEPLHFEPVCRNTTCEQRLSSPAPQHATSCSRNEASIWSPAHFPSHRTPKSIAQAVIVQLLCHLAG